MKQTIKINKPFKPDMKIKIIGDVHGEVEKYKKICENSDDCYMTIALGDMGFENEYKIIKSFGLDPDAHKILFGNHDYYPVLYTNKQSLSDYTSMKIGNEFVLMAIRGAKSVDKENRINNKLWFNEKEYKTWFEEEEICASHTEQILADFRKEKPNIVISHTCPRSIIESMFGLNPIPTRTNCLLEEMFEHHQPKEWVFGHFHRSVSKMIRGTKFTCLPELGEYEVYI